MAVYDDGDLGIEWAARAEDMEVIVADDTIVGYLETEAEDDGLYFEGYVHPGRRGEGIGSRLADSAERIAARTGAVTITTNVGGEDSVLFFEGRGYAVVEREYAMFLDLDGLPEVPVPPGIRIRPFVEGTDEDTMYQTIRTSFGDDWPDAPHDPEEWMRGHQSAPAYDPALWLFAESGGEVVGAVMNRGQWRAQSDTGWVKNLGVLPGWRGRGIGRVLLLESARLFHERGRRRMVLGVSVDNPTAAPAFYLRMGLKIGGASWDLRKAL